MRIYRKHGKRWFKNLAGTIEYGPFGSAKEARAHKKNYLRFIKFSNELQDRPRANCL